MYSSYEPIRHIKLEMPKLDADVNQAVYSVTQKIMTQAVENFDDAIYEGIIKIAKEKGISDLFFLNKSAVYEALAKRISQRVLVGNSPIERRCPCCNEIVGYISTVSKSSSEYCASCGQHLDWKE